MEIGAAIFFTDYSITPTDLAVALEERGFDSLWVAEHSHIPVSRRFSHPQGEAALVEVSDQLAPVANRSRPTTATRAHPRAPGRRRSSRGENSPCGGPSITRSALAPRARRRQSEGRW